MSTIRIVFYKKGIARYISHLDLTRTMQRSIRRAGLPAEYSKGFNPRPKIAYGPALALGISSDGELLDIKLREPVNVTEFIERLNACLPGGLGVTEAGYVSDGMPSLTAVINAAEYRITCKLSTPCREAEQRVKEFFVSDSILIRKTDKRGREKCIDIIPLIREVKRIEVREGHIIIEIMIDTGGGISLKPAEIADALSRYMGIPFIKIDIHRKGLFIRRSEAYFSPLKVSCRATGCQVT